MKTNARKPADLTRRDFLKGGSLATAMTVLGGVELTCRADAAEATEANPLHGPPVNVAVIGLGAWGREILSTLTRIPEANVVAICDAYPIFLRRAGKLCENAARVEDDRRILDNKDIKAVVIATPTHRHRDLALAALQAGKHVYCEAPLATTVKDARAIAVAARSAPRLVFQAGLQGRSDPQRLFVLKFVRSDAVGRPAMFRAQWFKKESWRQASPNPEREEALNWRLRQETSVGLVGEVGIHQMDTASWFLNARPTAVTGFGAIRCWKDGRTVADTAQVVFEYSDGVVASWEGTLSNSFLGNHEVLAGAHAAILFRDSRAWWFKEVDAPLFGWEVYAKKELVAEETGIVLRAGASKSTEETGKSSPNKPADKTPLEHALTNYLTNVNEVTAAVEDFTTLLNNHDPAALARHLAEVKLQPNAGYREGYEATVAVIKANEALVTGKRIVLSEELFALT
jgi:predicted dehydrogenase